MLTIGIDRPHKRNALDDATVEALERVFSDIPDGVRAVGAARRRRPISRPASTSTASASATSAAAVAHSRSWHRCFEKIEFGPVPVVAALKGAVIGGGLELAAAAHIRVAEPSAYYALPEGQRGIFVGGGGSVRLPKLIGVARMADMMLTGRVYRAEEGAQVGFAQYLVGEGEGFAKALALAETIAGNAPLQQFRRDPGAAAHRRQRSARRLTDGIADGRGRPERRRSQGARARLSRQARRQDAAE